MLSTGRFGGRDSMGRDFTGRDRSSLKTGCNRPTLQRMPPVLQRDRDTRPRISRRRRGRTPQKRRPQPSRSGRKSGGDHGKGLRPPLTIEKGAARRRNPRRCGRSSRGAADRAAAAGRAGRRESAGPRHGGAADRQRQRAVQDPVRPGFCHISTPLWRVFCVIHPNTAAARLFRQEDGGRPVARGSRSDGKAVTQGRHRHRIPRRGVPIRWKP
jgi:hypothetical protein